MSNKPQPVMGPVNQLWILQEEFSNSALVRDGSEKYPDDVNGRPNESWQHVLSAQPTLELIDKLQSILSAIEQIGPRNRMEYSFMKAREAKEAIRKWKDGLK